MSNPARYDITQITNRIHFGNLRGDVFGRLTTAIVALPLALAFSVASGAGSVAGLYGAVCLAFFGAFFKDMPTPDLWVDRTDDRSDDWDRDESNGGRV
jgi:MFS superfamily sulfate permease-like transporter